MPFASDPNLEDASQTTPASADFGRWLRRPGLWLLIGIVAAAAIVAAMRARGSVVPTAEVRRAAIAQHIVATGRVRVVTRVQLAAQVGGRVTAVRVAEGRQVQTGDVLVQLDDRDQRAEVARARAAVDQARGRLTQLRRVGAVVTGETSRQAAATLRRREAELSRVTALAEAGAVARAELEEAERAAEIARAQMRAADAELAAASPNGADWQVAEAAVAENEARLAAAEARLADTLLVAPADGTVLVRAVEPGDSVQTGVTLLEMAAAGITELVIEPDERNLAWIRPGQVARASADAFPDEVFEAVVRYIAPVVDARRGSIEVRLEVPSPPSVLRPDMTVSVDLVVASRDDVVVVPTDAVQSGGTDGPFVWVVADDRVSRRSVTLGIRGLGHTEVTDGLAPGNIVVTTPGAALEDGQRVRPRAEDR